MIDYINRTSFSAPQRDASDDIVSRLRRVGNRFQIFNGEFPGLVPPPNGTYGFLDSNGNWSQSGNVQINWDDVVEKPALFPPSTHTHSANDIVSGQFSSDRISLTSVLQYEAALRIGWGQLFDIPSDNNYKLQSVHEFFWIDDDFVVGHNIVGVRFLGEAFVYLPDNLSKGKIVTVKVESSVATAKVRLYAA